MNYSGNIVFFGTSDLDKSYNFYVELLNLELYKDQGVCHIYQITKGAMIGFCTHVEVLNQSHSPIITLLTEKVDRVYKKMVEAGISIIKKPQRNDKFNIYHFLAKDPDGYTVEFQKFL